MANELMFQIGIKEVKEKIDEIRKKYDDFEKKYGQAGITVKLNLQGATAEVDTLLKSLRMIGNADALKSLEQEFSQVKSQIDKATDALEKKKTASQNAANAGTKSANEEASAIDTLAYKYSRLVAQIENMQANLSKLLARGGHSDYYDSQIRSAITAFQNIKESLFKSDMSSDSFQNLSAQFNFWSKAYANVVRDANEFNKAAEKAAQEEEKAINKILAAEQRAGAKRVAEREKQEKEYEKVWQKGLQDREKAAEKAAAAELKSEIKGGTQGMSAAEKKRAEMEAAWREYEQQQQKQLQGMDKMAQKEAQIAEQSEQKRRNAAYKAAEAEVKARQKAEDEIIKAANKADEQLIAEKQKVAKERQKLAEQAAKAEQKAEEIALKAGMSAIEKRRLVEEKKQAEINAAWAQLAVKNYVPGTESVRTSMLQNEQKNNEKAVQSAWKAAEQKIKAEQTAANARERANQQATNAEIREHERALKAKIKAQEEAEKAVQITNSSLSQQSSVLSDLKTMAMQYLSVWGAKTFVNNIIELGGQLEQQRLSIGAILQDTAQANHLFGQIKDLAIKSPFGVQQLDAMTKQLSAYGFQYSELYDWTKRLADISAATGTSVDRLALALGHVRSEGALSGYTLRQFSMGNIPLLQKLSENLGKTKQEIRKMTRNKEIGYEDVLDVLRQLTDEGGMFFEAQETMAEALNAKFKNLRDSFQIMYSEMAEGAPGDFLKKVAETLTDISKAWRILMPLVIAGGTAFGVWKAATMAFNYEASKTGKLMTMNALATSKYSVAQLRAIATTGRFTLAMRGLRSALMSIGKYIFNPITLGFAAVEGLIYLWSKHNDEVRKAEDLTKSYSETAKESQKNIANQLENTKPYDEKLSDSEMKTGIESMTEDIKNYGVNGQKVLNDMAESAMTLAEKYQYLRKNLEETAKVYKEMERTAGAFEYGIKKSDSGWFDDNVETDLTQYANAFKDFEDAVTEFSSKYGDALKNSIEAAKKADPEFAKATANMKSYAQMLAEFWENRDKYKKAAEAVPYLIGDDTRPLYYDGSSGYLNYESKKREAMKELDEFFVNTEVKLKEKGYDFTKKLAPEQVNNLLKQSKDWLEKHPEWSNIYDVIYDKLDKRWGIKIEPDPKPVEEKLPQWIEDFQKELDGTGIKLTANMKMEQVIDEMKKVYDTAQTTINKLGPIAMQAKINFTGLKKEDIEYLRIKDPELYNTLSELIDAQEKLNTVDTAAKKRGVKLEGMKKDGSHKQDKKNQDAAKAVREQVRVIKEAADAFEYWRDKVGDKGAWEHVQSEFGDVLKKIGITADNIEDVRSHLNNIPNMKQYKAITDKKVKTEIDKEIAKENDQYIRKEFERDTENFLSKVQLELDSLTRAWETFNKVREATGNIDLAVQLSGIKYNGGKNQNIADALREKIQKDFASQGVTVDLNISLSDKQIEDEVKSLFFNAIPKREDFKEGEEGQEAYAKALEEHESKIKGLTEEYKKWRDLQRDVLQNDIDVFGKLLSSTVDLQSQVKKINDEYRKTIESLNRLKKEGKITDAQYGKAKSIADANTEMKLVQAKKEYQFLMDGVITMTKKSAQTIKDEYVKALKNQLLTGVITAKEYADKIKEVNDRMKELEYQKSDGMAYVEGGISGKANNMRKRASSDMKLAAQMQQEGQALIDQFKNGGNFQEYMRGIKMLNEGNDLEAAADSTSKFADGMEESAGQISVIVGLIDNCIQGFVGAIEEINEMEEALGYGNGFEEGDLAFFKGLSRSSGSISKTVSSWQSGDAGGMIQGAVGIVTGMVTELAKGHDARLDYQIQIAERQLNELKNIDSRLETQISRSLGGATSAGIDTRTLERYKKMLEANSIRQSAVSPIDEDFVAYIKEISELKNVSEETIRAISTALGNNSALSAQYASLLEQRDLIEKQLENERAKKDDDADAIEEYQQKLSELNDQIRYWVEDVGSELYGLDLKGWASQIGDALMTAFENGEDAAKAFEDTAKDIIKSVASEILKLKIIEPMMGDLRDELFGYTDSNGNIVSTGVYNSTTGRFDEEETLRILGKYFGEGGVLSSVVGASEQFYDLIKQITGMNLSNEDSISSVGSSIRGITENTADLLASYVNAIRADESTNRQMIAQYYPQFLSALTRNNDLANSQMAQLQAIARNTLRNADAADKIYDILRASQNGSRRLEVQVYSR